MSKLFFIVILFAGFCCFSQSEYTVDSLPKEVNLIGKDTVYSFKKGSVYPHYINVLKSNRELSFDGSEVLCRKGDLYFLNFLRNESKNYDSIDVYSNVDTIRLRLMPCRFVFFGLFLNDKRVERDSVTANSLRSGLRLKAIHQEGDEKFEYYFPEPRAKFDVELSHIRGQSLIDSWDVKTRGPLLISDERIKALQEGDRLLITYFIQYRKTSYRPIECMSILHIKG